jgi:hypothetical protein
MTTQGQDHIGVAWMDEDGTIHLRLRAHQGNTIGESFLSYAPDHADYSEILAHLDGLKQGEYKEVPAWTDTEGQEQPANQGRGIECSPPTSSNNCT